MSASIPKMGGISCFWGLARSTFYFRYAFPVQFTLAYIGSKLAASDPCEILTHMYVLRAGAFMDCEVRQFRSEESLFEWIDRQQRRTRVLPILLDSQGKQLSSETLAQWIGKERDNGVQHLVFAIGPADGWSPDRRKGARMLLSLGPLTLAHALARVVLAEQLYRACTILAGHPYHTGH